MLAVQVCLAAAGVLPSGMGCQPAEQHKCSGQALWIGQQQQELWLQHGQDVYAAGSWPLLKLESSSLIILMCLHLDRIVKEPLDVQDLETSTITTYWHPTS
jgi:hypothetical protein